MATNQGAGNRTLNLRVMCVSNKPSASEGRTESDFYLEGELLKSRHSKVTRMLNLEHQEVIGRHRASSRQKLRIQLLSHKTLELDLGKPLSDPYTLTQDEQLS